MQEYEARVISLHRDSSRPSALDVPGALTRALNEAQEDGRACVVCGRDFELDPGQTPSRPVGRSATGVQVFVCNPCVPRLVELLDGLFDPNA